MYHPTTIWCIFSPTISLHTDSTMTTEKAAQDEAVRLAAKYPGSEFYVMRSISRSVSHGVVTQLTKPA